MDNPYDDWVRSTLGVDPSSYETVIGQDTDARQGGGEADAIGNPLSKAAAAIKGKLAGKKPVPRASLGPGQTTRAEKLRDGMQPADKKRVDALFAKAKGDEKSYLTKALASGHSADELDKFFKAIKGKSHKWMENNLHIVDDTSGHGVMQQWQMSCAPTTAQAARAELDPVYALKLRTENPSLEKADDSDGASLNPTLAKEQGDMLRSKGAIPTNRGVDGQGLSVASVTELYDSSSSASGVTYDTKPVTDSNMDTSLGEVDQSLGQGLPVPLLVGDGSGPKHAVLITGMDPGPPRRYTIAAPGAGKSMTVTDADIKAKHLNIDGWTTVTHFSKPTIHDPPDPPPPPSGAASAPPASAAPSAGGSAA